MPITATQQERRKSCLGSSDMAAVLGCDNYRNAHDVWLEKTGKLAPLEPNEAMILGTHLEDGILQVAERSLGKLIRNQYRSARDRGIPLGANIDALVVASGLPVEVKTSGLKWSGSAENWGDEGTDQVPDRVIVQTHVHMVCSETDTCHVPALIGGRGFQIFVVRRDEEIANRISEAAIDFWQKHVVADEPPQSIMPHMESLKRVRREPAMYAEELSPKLVDNWLEAKEKLKAAEEAKKLAETALLTALGTAEGAIVPAGTFTYLEQSRVNIDAARLKAEYPDVYEAYAKTSSYRVARFKKAK